MLHNQEDRCQTFDLLMTQFWGGEVSNGIGNGDHLVVTVHQMVVVIGRLRLVAAR